MNELTSGQIKAILNQAPVSANACLYDEVNLCVTYKSLGMREKIHDFCDLIELKKLREENEALKSVNTDAVKALADTADLRRERDSLDAFLKFVISASFEGCDTDGASAQDKALELGLLREEIYDKEIHGDDPQDFYEVEEGKTLLVYNNKIRNGDAE